MRGPLHRPGLALTQRCIAISALLCALGPGAAWCAPALLVSDAWMRAPRPGFASTMIFMKLAAGADSELVGASTPLAAAVELHHMVREGSVVQMLAVPSIALPGGRETELRAGEGAFHLMALKLRGPLKPGQPLALQLKLKDAAGQFSSHRVMVRVVAPKGGHEHGAEDPH